MNSRLKGYVNYISGLYQEEDVNEENIKPSCFGDGEDDGINNCNSCEYYYECLGSENNVRDGEFLTEDPTSKEIFEVKKQVSYIMRGY